jgi:kynurenine formamidase
MRSIIFALLFCYLLLFTSCTQSRGDVVTRWIDLTYDFSDQTIYWPTSDTFHFATVYAGKTEKGYYYSAYKFCAAEHGGTHIDAPVHFAEGRNSVDEIPFTQLIATAIKIDVSKRALQNRDYQISINDLKEWEAKEGHIPDNAILLFYTGYGQYWPDRIKYMGTDKRGEAGVAELHFPGLLPETAQWLINNRSIAAVGLDTPSIDYGQSKKFESHVLLLDKNIPVFENVANLDKLPAKGMRVIALPMKIKGGSGGPLRIIAEIKG